MFFLQIISQQWPLYRNILKVKECLIHILFRSADDIFSLYFYFGALNKQEKSSLKNENQSVHLLIPYRIAESERLKNVFEKAHWMFLLVPT